MSPAVSAEDWLRHVLAVLAHVRAAPGDLRWSWVRADELAALRSRQLGRRPPLPTGPEVGHARRAMRRLAQHGMVQLSRVPPIAGPLEPLRLLDWPTRQVRVVPAELALAQLAWGRLPVLADAPTPAGPELPDVHEQLEGLLAGADADLAAALEHLPPLLEGEADEDGEVRRSHAPAPAYALTRTRRDAA